MIGDRDLFGNDNAAARARRTDPDTSHLAAEDVTPSLRQLQAAVLAYAAQRGHGGFIDPEMNGDFGTHLSTYRTRRAELVDLGLIENKGERLQVGERGASTRSGALPPRDVPSIRASLWTGSARLHDVDEEDEDAALDRLLREFGFPPSRPSQHFGDGLLPRLDDLENWGWE